jgi:phenylacetate-CoA ligase
MTNVLHRLQTQIAFAYEHTPAVRQIMDGVGLKPSDIQTTADLGKIPVTSKDKLIAMQQANPPFGGFLAVNLDTLPRIYISPGPIYDPQRPNEEAEGGVQALRIAGFGKGDRVINTFMYHLTPAGLLMDEGLRHVGCTVIPTGPGNTEMQVMLIDTLKVTGYVGTPSFLATLFDAAIKFGYDPKAMTLKKAFLTAEPYPPSLRTRFEGEYGMKTTNAYGTADLGFVGFSVGDTPGFCISEDVYLEIADPKTGQPLPNGEVGEIVATTFNNTYALVRFGTGDLGSLAAEAHPACEGRQHLTGLFGRSGDAIKVRGMFLHPNQIAMAVAKVPEIKHAQAVITRVGSRDHVTVRIQLKPEHTDHPSISDVLKQHIQTAARLKVDEVVIVDSGVIDPAQRMVRDERKWD